MCTCRQKHVWIEDSAIFDVARNLEGLDQCAWWDWPEDLRFRKPAALEEFKKEHRTKIDTFIAIQFLFDRQWKAIKAYANGKGIKIIGDMPIYVGGHSADVWANQVCIDRSPGFGALGSRPGQPPVSLPCEYSMAKNLLQLSSRTAWSAIHLAD